MKRQHFATLIAIAFTLGTSVAHATEAPVPVPVTTPTVGIDANGAANADAAAKAAADLKAQQDLKAAQDLKAQQDLQQKANLNQHGTQAQDQNLKGSVTGTATTMSGPASSVSGPANTTGGNAATTGGSANTTSGPASTTGGNVKTAVGVGIDAGVKQNVDGSAGGNTLKTGDATAKGGTGYGGNTGAISVTPKIDVGTNATANGGNVAGAGNSNVKDVGNGNGSGNKLSSAANSNSTASGNGSGNTTRSGDSVSTATGNGAGNATNVNTSSTYIDKRIEVPVLFNPVPASQLAVGNMSVVQGVCGPRQVVVKTPIVGTQVGIIFKSHVDLGGNYDLEPELDANGQRVFYIEREFIENGTKVFRRFGTRADTYTGILGVAGATSVSFGFAGTSGGANGGAGASSSMQQIASRIIISDCEIPGAYSIAKVLVEPPVAQLTRDDILGALSVLNNLKLDVTVPTERVESTRVQCKVEEFTDAAGKKISMCRGSSKGSYGITKVVPSSVTVRGELRAGAAAKMK